MDSGLILLIGAAIVSLIALVVLLHLLAEMDRKQR